MDFGTLLGAWMIGANHRSKTDTRTAKQKYAELKAVHGEEAAETFAHEHNDNAGWLDERIPSRTHSPGTIARNTAAMVQRRERRLRQEQFKREEALRLIERREARAKFQSKVDRNLIYIVPGLVTALLFAALILTLKGSN